jgi:LPS O-antigen subunit length determinant protein (WzzB/FepE family)
MKKAGSEALVIREDEFDSQLSLLDLVAFTRRNCRVIFGGAFIGAILGLGVALLLPAEWEASALVRVGQFGNASSSGNPIEPALQVVDRIKNKSFQNEVMKKIGLSLDEDDDKNELFRKTLKVKLEKSDLISINIRSLSADSAKFQLSTVVDELKSIHTRMLAPTINRWHQELDTIQLELKRSSIDLERLTKSLDGRSESLNPSSFAQAALVSNIMIAREEELRNFRDRKLILEEMLSPERTFVTSVIGQIEVSNKAVYPKKQLFVLAGLLLGLLLGAVFVITNNIAKKINE